MDLGPIGGSGHLKQQSICRSPKIRGGVATPVSSESTYNTPNRNLDYQDVQSPPVRAVSRAPQNYAAARLFGHGSPSEINFDPKASYNRGVYRFPVGADNGRFVSR